MKEYGDEELLQLLQSANAPEADRALKYLYQRLYKMIQHFILTNNGRPDEVEDVFQDAMVVLYNQVRRPDFALTSTLSTYFYSVCRNLWLKQLRKRQRNTTLTEEAERIPVAETQFEVLVASEQAQLIADLLKELGSDCQKILHYFYYERLRMKEIIEHMGISSVAVAKNKKSNCMKQLRKLAAGKNWL
ncbi:MAG: sigma-70 family RNA polymerase sigma factor [Bacteroidota bacterium]